MIGQEQYATCSALVTSPFGNFHFPHQSSIPLNGELKGAHSHHLAEGHQMETHADTTHVHDW